MRIFGCSVFDEKAGAFDKPFFVVSLGVATRMFTDAVRQGETPLSKHPGDFKLYHVCDFDPESAGVTAVEPPKFIAHGSDFVEATPVMREVKDGSSHA